MHGIVCALVLMDNERLPWRAVVLKYIFKHAHDIAYCHKYNRSCDITLLVKEPLEGVKWQSCSYDHYTPMPLQLAYLSNRKRFNAIEA